MRILTKKEEKEIEAIKRQNEFFSRGWRAMTQVLDYQRAIVAILRSLGLEEIEIEDCLLYRSNEEIEVQRTQHHTTIIKLKEQKC